jgi:hypothetical protein
MRKRERIVYLFLLIGAILLISWSAGFAQPGKVDISGYPAIKTDESGAIDNFNQDQSSDRVNLFFHKHLGSPIVLTSGTSIDDKVLNVEAGYTAGVGNLICLKEGTEFYQGTILSNTAATITLDMPLDYAYSAGAVCTATSKHMNVDGSVTPQIFHIQPNVGTKWHMNRLIFLIEGTAAMDAGDFGDQPALANGIVIRKKDGDYQNILNVKTNGDFALEAGPMGVEYDPKPPAGTTAIRIELEFEDVVIELDGDNGDELEIIIQDNITLVPNFITKGLGHLVVD